MKKIIFILLTLFIFYSNVFALEQFYLSEKMNGMHVGTITDEMKYHNGVPFMIKRKSDDQYVYCLDHHNQSIAGDYNNYIDGNVVNLSKEQIEKINLYAYYGYGYGNHVNKHWYGVTQFLIWKTLGYRDVFFTDSAYGNRINAYSEEIKEIKNLVNKHKTLPSFSNDTFDFTINNTYEINDLNEVLNNYEIKSSNIVSRIENNNLYINTTEKGIYEITFIRKSPVNNDYIIYKNDTSQPLIFPGRLEEIEFKINIVVESGNITINNLDSENKEREFATLEGAKYGLYDDNNLITTISTDLNNIGFIEEIPFGKYYIKQLESGLGYKLDKNIYEIEITKNNKNVVINSYNEVIKGNLKINKYYGEKDNYKLEDNATFQIYNINDNLIGEYKTKEGIINIELEYGKYYIIQTSGKEGYKFEDKKYVNIEEENEYILNLYDEIIKGNLKINKYYGEKDNYKLEDNATFQIYNINDNLIGEYKTKEGIINIELNYGDYYIVQEKGKDGYKLIEKTSLSIKEEKQYILDLYNEKEDILVVEVPNTKKYNYNKFVSLLCIILGLVLFYRAKKKTT